MEDGRSPNRHSSNPPAARALALIREAVAAAECRAGVGPSSTASPSPRPSRRYLPSAEPTYPQRHYMYQGSPYVPQHTHEGLANRPQEGHNREEGWSRAPPRVIFAPKDGPGPISGAQHSDPQPQQAQHAGPGYRFRQGETQQGDRGSASLSSSRSLGSLPDLPGVQYPYPQESWGHGGGGVRPHGRPYEARMEAPAGRAEGRDYPTGGFRYEQDGARPAMVSHVLSAFPSSGSGDLHPYSQHSHSAAGAGCWPEGYGDLARSRAGTQPPLGSRPELVAAQSTSSWHQQVTHQSVGSGAWTAVPSPGAAPPGTWHSTPHTGWHHTLLETPLGQARVSPQGPDTVTGIPTNWQRHGGRTPAQGSLVQATGAEAGQQGQALGEPWVGRGAAAVPERREGRVEGLVPEVQPLPGLEAPIHQAPALRSAQHLPPLSLPVGSPLGLINYHQVSPTESLRGQFSLSQLSELDVVPPGLQAWELEGAPDRGGLDAGLGGEGEATSCELSAECGDEMELGEWMDGGALQTPQTLPAPTPAAQAPPAQAAVTRPPARKAAVSAGDPAKPAQGLVPPADQASLQATRDVPQARAGEQPAGPLGAMPGALGSKHPRGGTSVGWGERESGERMQQSRSNAAGGVPGKRQLDSMDGAASGAAPAAMETGVAEGKTESGSVQRQNESGGVTREAVPKVSAKTKARTQIRSRVLLPPDGQFWTKYGEKVIVSDSVTRSYFRCSHARSHACSAKKVVDFNTTSSLATPRIQYTGTHSHPPPPQDLRVRSTAPGNTLGSSEVYHVTSVPAIETARPREGVPGEHQAPPGSMRDPGGT